MVSNVRLAFLATMPDGPYDLTQEQTSKGQSLGNGLAEGAVKEAKAKFRTLQYEVERGLSHTVPENHDTLAWATVNWHLAGVDGRHTVPKQNGGKSFRRVVAPSGQKVVEMATGKDARWISAGRRWREGVLMGRSPVVRVVVVLVPRSRLVTNSLFFQRGYV